MKKNSIWPRPLIQISRILNAHVWLAISALLSTHASGTVAVPPGVLRVVVKKNHCYIAKDRQMNKLRTVSSIFSKKSRTRFLSQALSKMKWSWSIKKKTQVSRTIVKGIQQTSMKSKVRVKTNANRNRKTWLKGKRNRRQPILKRKGPDSLRETSLKWYSWPRYGGSYTKVSHGAWSRLPS